MLSRYDLIRLESVVLQTSLFDIQQTYKSIRHPANLQRCSVARFLQGPPQILLNKLFTHEKMFHFLFFDNENHEQARRVIRDRRFLPRVAES